MSWSERWQQMLHSMGYESQLRRGRSYVRRGRVKSLEMQAGAVTAQVEDRDQGTCDVTVRVNRFDDATWSRILDVLGGQAIYAAQLLAGDMPVNIQQIFEENGASLLPGGSYDIEFSCDRCEDWDQPCKHTSSVLYLLGEMLDDDPWLLLRLRGRDRQQVLQAMRRRRSEGDATLPAAGAAPVQAVQGPTLGTLSDGGAAMPLVAQIEHFWGDSKGLSRLHHHIGPPTIKRALLRRLGRPPFAAESIETYDRLGEVYDQVTQRALELAFAPDPDDEED